jgi:hypothetical protein
MWGWYAKTHTLNMYSIFLPMLTSSTIGLALYIQSCYQWYKTLPTQEAHLQEKVTHGSIIKNRLYNYLNQLSHLAFSGNVLVPVFAAHSGFQAAALVKLASQGMYTVTTVIHKIFGVTAEALLTHARQLGLQHTNKAFGILTSTIHQAVYAVIIFFSINYLALIRCAHSPTDQSLWIALLLLLILQITEYFFISYEKLFAIHERSDILLFLNSVALATSLATIMCNSALGNSITIIFLLIIRCILFFCMHRLSQVTWLVQAQWSMRPRYFVTALLGSLGILLIIR